MMAYLKILRPTNLIIVAFTQSFFFYFLIQPNLEKASLISQMAGTRFPLFILSTLCLVAAGNLINDILDQNSDQINKPKKAFIKNMISPKKAWIYYAAIVLLGLLLAIYIGFSIGKWPLIFIYPMVTFLLYWYSATLKHLPLIGNIFVAFFTGFVVWILMLCEPILLSQDIVVTNIKMVLIGFGIFSFLANLIREIVKDIEDIEGDTQNGSRTLPIVKGIPFSKKMVYLLIGIMLVSLFIWWRQFIQFADFRSSIFLVLFIGGPLVLSIYKINNAEEKKQYSAISRFYKLILLSGLLYAFLIIQNISNG